MFFVSVFNAKGHGLMVDPPARNTIWRLGFDNPINYDDMALNCGGFYVSRLLLKANHACEKITLVLIKFSKISFTCAQSFDSFLKLARWL